MIISPRYDGPTVLSIDGAPADQLLPLRRQHRRLQAMVAAMTDEQLRAPSRCDGWAARDVVAHLVDVNAFWHASISAGLAGTPSRLLAGFDPATTPPMLVDMMTALDARQVVDQFLATSEALLDIVSDLTDEQWSMLAESPAGHVPIRLVVQHSLWDSWVHERDIAVPLGLAPAVEPDELRSCLQYAAVIGPVLALGMGGSTPTVVAVEATDPAIRFVVEVGDTVSLRDEGATDVPCLRASALALVEALSLRAEMPVPIPVEWSTLLAGLTTAFDAVAT